jgi:membrane associated rhomboid family serine protease
MLFLWIFGDNVEDRFGHILFVVFYISAGLVAGAVHMLTITQAQANLPTIGASGAVSGILGAYLILFPRVQVLVYFGFIFFTRLPSWMAIGSWFILQLIPVFLLSPKESAGIAYWAHIGGFAFGFVVTILLRALGLVTPGPYVRRPEAA